MNESIDIELVLPNVLLAQLEQRAAKEGVFCKILVENLLHEYATSKLKVV